jgi:hypothetical protein
LLSLFGKISNIDKFDIIWGNTYIPNKVSHLTIRGFIQIS